MKFVTEYGCEWQKRLKEAGYNLVAPNEGCFVHIDDARDVASKYKDAYIVCHTYGGRARGYMVFAK